MSFVDFPDQRPVVELLQRSLEKGRVAHGYLFTGSDLADLEAVARTFIKTLNCQSPRRSASGAAIDSCDRCAVCTRIDSSTHPDVQWVRPESKLRVITIDQMRELMQTIHLKPYEAAVKASVIVAADRLNVQAANAFLKTLEEPPAKSVIILLSTEPQRVMETILSRCLRLNFAGTGHLNLSDDDKQWINDFANAAALAGEGLLSRYRLLSVLLQRLSSIKELIEKELTARSPLEKYDDVETRVKEKWEVELTAAIEAEYRHRRAGVLSVLQWWLRDVWLLSFGSKENSMFPDLQPVSETVAGRIASKDALHNIEVLEKTQRLLSSNIQEALALEVGLLKLRF